VPSLARTHAHAQSVLSPTYTYARAQCVIEVLNSFWAFSNLGDYFDYFDYVNLLGISIWDLGFKTSIDKRTD
jgi:hypothetical protein